jgi:hypothetical protein
MTCSEVPAIKLAVIVRMVIMISRTLVFLLLLTSQASAGTGLEIEMNGCRRGADEVVVCDFSFRSAGGGSNALTGGQYSQAMDNSGTVYDAIEVRIGVESGLAVFFESDPGIHYSGKLFFDGVDISVDLFKLVTMRFSDGDWQQSNVVIEN